MYAVQLQITTKKLFLKWSYHYLIFYYKIEMDDLKAGIIMPYWSCILISLEIKFRP